MPAGPADRRFIIDTLRQAYDAVYGVGRAP